MKTNKEIRKFVEEFKCKHCREKYPGECCDSIFHKVELIKAAFKESEKKSTKKILYCDSCGDSLINGKTKEVKGKQLCRECFMKL